MAGNFFNTTISDVDSLPEVHARYLKKIDGQVKAVAAMARRNPAVAETIEKMLIFNLGVLMCLNAENEEEDTTVVAPRK